MPPIVYAPPSSPLLPPGFWISGRELVVSSVMRHLCGPWSSLCAFRDAPTPTGMYFLSQKAGRHSSLDFTWRLACVFVSGRVFGCVCVWVRRRIFSILVLHCLRCTAFVVPVCRPPIFFREVLTLSSDPTCGSDTELFELDTSGLGL